MKAEVKTRNVPEFVGRLILGKHKRMCIVKLGRWHMLVIPAFEKQKQKMRS